MEGLHVLINEDDGWICTYTGGRFYPLNPRVEDVRIEDIARALSYMCRYNGHVSRFYSVGEHSLNMALVAPDGYKLEALLHDASEAYMADVVRPAKKNMPEYKAIEHRIELVVAERFNLKPNYMDIIKDFDNRIIVNERASLFPSFTRDWACDEEKLEPLDGLEDCCFGFTPMSVIEQAFLDQFKSLYRGN